MMNEKMNIDVTVNCAQSNEAKKSKKKTRVFKTPFLPKKEARLAALLPVELPFCVLRLQMEKTDEFKDFVLMSNKQSTMGMIKYELDPTSDPDIPVRHTSNVRLEADLFGNYSIEWSYRYLGEADNSTFDDKIILMPGMYLVEYDTFCLMLKWNMLTDEQLALEGFLRDNDYTTWRNSLNHRINGLGKEVLGIIHELNHGDYYKGAYGSYDHLCEYDKLMDLVRLITTGRFVEQDDDEEIELVVDDDDPSPVRVMR